MTENPFSAPTSEPSHEPPPRRDPLAGYSDKELKKLLQYYRDRFAWSAYFGLLAFVNIVVALTGEGVVFFRVLFLMVGAWFGATLVLMKMRHLLGRIMAFITFALMVLIALVALIMGNLPGVVGLALGVAGIKHVYDTKGIDEGTVPPHKVLKQEKKRRKKQARN